MGNRNHHKVSLEQTKPSVKYTIPNWNINRGLIPADPTNLDRYYRSAADLHIHFEIERRGIKLDYCAVLRKVVAGQTVGESIDISSNIELEDWIVQTVAYDDELSVLIGVFEAVDDADPGCLNVPTSVWLRPYDDCLSRSGQSPDAPLKSIPSVRVWIKELPKPISRSGINIGNWIGSMLPLLARRASHDNVIERTTQVVDELTQDDGDKRVGIIHDKSIEPLVIVLGLPYWDQVVRVAFLVGSQQSLDFHHVMLCPLDLEPPRITTSHEVSSTYERQPVGPAQTDDPEGPRDTRTYTEGGRGRARETGALPEALNPSSPPEEVASRPSTGRRHGASSAKRTRSGSPEDA